MAEPAKQNPKKPKKEFKPEVYTPVEIPLGTPYWMVIHDAPLDRIPASQVPRRKHLSFEAAAEEADRLATKYPEKSFSVLAFVSGIYKDKETAAEDARRMAKKVRHNLKKGFDKNKKIHEAMQKEFASKKPTKEYVKPEDRYIKPGSDRPPATARRRVAKDFGEKK